MARDFALSLNKPVKSKYALNNSCFYDFLKRWPNLKIVKPQKLAMARAKCASKENLDNYFRELGTILTNNDLHNHPQRIYNVDETGVRTEHSPPPKKKKLYVPKKQQLNPLRHRRLTTLPSLEEAMPLVIIYRHILFSQARDGIMSFWVVQLQGQMVKCQQKDGQIQLFSIIT